MDTKIITISREFGSGGRSIGKAIAKQLDIPYYDKELVKQVALETKFDEKYIEDAGEYSPGATSLSYDRYRLGKPALYDLKDADKTQINNTVKTGDVASVWFFCMLMIAAGGAAGTVVYRRKMR